ncbi:response regulator [Sulfitobacter geojensis]|nr:response regulator [Sulfitobacter geojensis]
MKMNKIPVAVVDDDSADRYIVKRRLSKAEGFEDVTEFTGGHELLERFFSDQLDTTSQDLPLLILMDINMPQMDGFETIEEMQKRRTKGYGPESMVVMMFTSSNNPSDRERAGNLDLVKGFITKPLDGSGAEVIRTLYYA